MQTPDSSLLSSAFIYYKYGTVLCKASAQRAHPRGLLTRVVCQRQRYHSPLSKRKRHAISGACGRALQLLWLAARSALERARGLQWGAPRVRALSTVNRLRYEVSLLFTAFITLCRGGKC